MNIFKGLAIWIASRRLFKNWLSAGLKYFLVKHGLAKGDVIVECNGKKYTLRPEMYTTIIYAYHRRAFEELECGDSLYAVVTYKGRRVRLYDSFEFLYDIVFENFACGAYDDLDVRDRVVVDVGAGVGDTAILFSLMGAKKVIALEPFPSLYEKALVNVKINGVEDKVLLLNAGLGPFDSKVHAKSGEVRGYYSFKPSTNGVKVRMYTLGSLIGELGIERGSVLKVDCEGCEYEAVLSAKPEDLAVFEQIVIEYHNGYAELKRFLENAGFATTIKPIRSVYQPIEKQGYVVARLRHQDKLKN
jgi:FkbM family methyltransferase